MIRRHAQGMVAGCVDTKNDSTCCMIMNKIAELLEEWKALQPLKDEDRIRLDRKFMLEFNYNSNHIEGNTLTYGQTEMLLMFGKVVDGADMKDLEEMKASNVGLKMVREMAADQGRHLTEYFIRTLHHTLLREDYTVYRRQPDGTSTSYTVHAGQYKTRPNSVITVTGERFEYASPEETPALMTDLVNWYVAEEASGRLSPVELAALFHYRYIRIHPFEDGNGRISRLIVNYILARHGYPMIVVKSSDKANYLTALNRCDVAVGPVPSDGARAELSQVAPFVDYIGGCVERALTVSVRAAKGESIEDADDWRKSLKLKYHDKIDKPEVTDDVAARIEREDYKAVLAQVDRELKEFYSLFTSVRWTPSVAGYEYDIEKQEFRSEIDFYKEFDKVKTGFTVCVKLIIRQFAYKIEVMYIKDMMGQPLYNKEYDYTCLITEKDRADIVNAIGRLLNRFLDVKGLFVRL